MVKCLPEFEYFTAFLKNKNIIFKIRRSKVTDYAALSNKIPTPQSQLLHLTKYIQTLYLQQMHKLM